MDHMENIEKQETRHHTKGIVELSMLYLAEGTRMALSKHVYQKYGIWSANIGESDIVVWFPQYLNFLAFEQEHERTFLSDLRCVPGDLRQCILAADAEGADYLMFSAVIPPDTSFIPAEITEKAGNADKEDAKKGNFRRKVVPASALPQTGPKKKRIIFVSGSTDGGRKPDPPGDR